MFRTVLIIAIVAGVTPGAFAQTDKKPNIIFILADDMDYQPVNSSQRILFTPILSTYSR